MFRRLKGHLFFAVGKLPFVAVGACEIAVEGG